MAKYAVTHKCGHEERHELFGKHTERDSKIKWLATVDCSDCYRQAKIKVEQETAAKFESETPNLPELVGSEKQIAWAKSIRARIIGEGSINVVYQQALITTSAKWLIENRGA